MKTAQATEQAANCVALHLFSRCERQNTMSCLCLRLWKMCSVHKGHCSCFPFQDLLICKNYSFVSFLSYTPIFPHLNGPSSWPKSALHIFFHLTGKSSGGRAKVWAIHSAVSKWSTQTLMFHLFIPERFQRDCSCLLIIHPWNLARGRFLHSGDNLKSWVSCLLRKRWGTIAGTKFVGLQSKNFTPCEPATSHPPSLCLQYNYVILLFYHKWPL